MPGVGYATTVEGLFVDIHAKTSNTPRTLLCSRCSARYMGEARKQVAAANEI
ncbi:MAG: hypothetical protein ACI9XK_004009 [Granulosicoccus sp.]|jgi:hypothetical protein